MQYLVPVAAPPLPNKPPFICLYTMNNSDHEISHSKVNLGGSTSNNDSSWVGIDDTFVFAE